MRREDVRCCKLITSAHAFLLVISLVVGGLRVKLPRAETELASFLKSSKVGYRV